MEQRKLQEVGGGTYTVSVPKEWAAAHSLSAGAEVHLYTHTDGSLVLRTDPKEADGAGEVRIDAGERDPAAVRADLVGTHAAGFDSVAVEADGGLSDEQRRAVESAVRGLPGMAITETERGIRGRNLLDVAEFSVRQSVVQLRLVALTALREAMGELTGDGDTAAERLSERTAEADRLYGVIERQFSRSLTSFETLDKLNLRRSELFDYYSAAGELRRVADASVAVVDVASALPERPPEEATAELRELATSLPTVTEDAVTAILAADYAGARDALDEQAAASATIRRLKRNPPGTFETPAGRARYLRALDSLERVVDSLRALASVAVRSVRRADAE